MSSDDKSDALIIQRFKKRNFKMDVHCELQELQQDKSVPDRSMPATGWRSYILVRTDVVPSCPMDR